MLRHNVENDSHVKDEIERSRRSFFSRLAVGAVLSIAMPGVVHAAKSAAVKADKNHRLAKSTRSAVRLPKQSDIQKTKLARQTSKVVSSHKAGKPQKTSSGKSTTHHKPAAAERGHLHTAHGQHNARVRDVYNGKNHTTHVAANHSGKNINHAGRTQSVIQPVEREPIIETTQRPMFLADHGRLPSHRSLAFQNPHTGDKLSLTYFEKGRYLTDALEEINFLLRDYRTGDVHPIDPGLLDQLHDLKQMLGLAQPFDVISGYRSPLTNARLHAEHAGVANNSFHIQGRAVDIRIERLDIRRIHNAAIAMHRGGVGYYPKSNFIHLDTGTFRTWTL